MNLMISQPELTGRANGRKTTVDLQEVNAEA